MYTELEVTKLKNEIADKCNDDANFRENYAISVEGDGNGILLIGYNESLSPAKITVVAADNVFCGGDHTIYMMPNCRSVIRFEGAPYVQRSGEYAGKILIQCEEGEGSFSVAEII